MSAASTEEPQVNDDLTAIGGIGPARAAVLRDAGIRTFRDLAALSVDEIDSRLRAEGQFVGKDDIEGWIVEARELTAEDPSATGGSKWHVAASFVVEFQTREEDAERRTKIHHVEQDVDERWPDFEHEQLCRWMMAQLGEPVDEVPEDLRAQVLQTLEEELQQRRAAEREALQEELEGERAQAQQELEAELKAERARRQKEMERALEARIEQAEEALHQSLEKQRARARQELDEELKAQRVRRLEEIDRELEQRRAEVEQALEQELQRLRAEARESLPAQPEEEAQPEAEVRAALGPATVVAPGRVVLAQRPEIAIVEMRIYQPPQAERPRVLGTRAGSPDTFRSDAPFAVVVSLSVDETQVDELAAKGVTFTAQCRVRKMPSGEIRELGTTPPQRIVAGRSTYEAGLSGVTLPAGLYWLAAYVSTWTAPPGGAYREVGVLLMA